jgi:hypothetical protein
MQVWSKTFGEADFSVDGGLSRPGAQPPSPQQLQLKAQHSPSRENLAAGINLVLTHGIFVSNSKPKYPPEEGLSS